MGGTSGRKAATLVMGLSCLLLAACQAVDRGSFGLFDRSLNDTSYGYAVVPDPTGTAPTKMVERFEVRPGDCDWDSGWNDCSNDRERSEVSEQDRGASYGATAWYGWSLYVPDDAVNVFPTKVAFGQFQQHDASPLWMFQNGSGGYHVEEQLGGGGRPPAELVPAAALKGRWHRIEVQARWSAGMDGFFRVWADGEQKVDYAGPTASAPRVYLRYGIYRAFLSRYKDAHAGKAVPAQVVYFANVRRARTREGLAAPAS